MTELTRLDEALATAQAVGGVGVLPEAPLAMPTQVLEGPGLRWLVLRMFRLAGGAQRRAGG